MIIIIIPSRRIDLRMLGPALSQSRLWHRSSIDFDSPSNGDILSKSIFDGFIKVACTGL